MGKMFPGVSFVFGIFGTFGGLGLVACGDNLDPASRTPPEPPTVVGPRVVATTPAQNAHSAAVDTVIEIRFSEPMVRDDGAVSVVVTAPGVGEPPAVALAWTSDSLAIALPPAPGQAAPGAWPHQAAVEVRIDGRLESRLGVPMARSFSLAFATALAPCIARTQGEGGPWRFVDVGVQAAPGAGHRGVDPELATETRILSGGVAAGDYDRDCRVDLYAITGAGQPDALLRNRGDGGFDDETFKLPVQPTTWTGGPLWADLDGDGWLDLFVGDIERDDAHVYTSAAGQVFGYRTFVGAYPVYSAAAGDYDLDGDLDLFLAHWKRTQFTAPRYLWQNDGAGRFTDVSVAAGLAGYVQYLFAPVFTDLDADGWPDLVVAGDWGTSMALVGSSGGVFAHTGIGVISDENGMGTSVGDFDGDGALDWFVTSIHDPNGVAEGNWGVTGNRLYRGLGDGSFVDATAASGVREGYWGWASCAADLDNDGDLDLFHVNGMGLRGLGDSTAFDEFLDDPSRLFINDGAGRFSERSVELGLVDDGQGRGVACFDYDRDGDVDIAVAGNGDPLRIWRNDGDKPGRFLVVRLQGPAGNRFGVGARITVEAAGAVQPSQLREIRAGSNFASQDPAEAHFGLGSSELADRLEVRWPDGEVTELFGIPADQFVLVRHPDSSAE